ncbi:MAG TPA: sigma-70 family RNA polymerase sigma factor [Candidatus Dormibacteraeota bacterium]|nr:sigma-70 family RNA polymerase sigma factor [Candidatus Dormibacteraeota bacterium]
MAAAPFADVYEAHAPAVYRYCLARLGDPCAAEDAAAETFSSAYAAWDTFGDEDPTGVRRWIFRIARNAAVDHHRRRRRGASLLGRLRPAGGDGSGTGADVETVAQLRAELRAALAAVAGLGRRDRELVGLRVAAGLSFAEIAAVLGTSEQAARTATHRALLKVRTALEGTER